MPASPVYLVGIGISPWSWSRTSLPWMKTRSAVHQLALSAGTKALLDAGVSYDDVDHSIGCGDLANDNEVFYTFGKTGIPIHTVDNYTGLHAAINFVKTGNADCVMMISVDQNAAVGIIMASEAFLWRHPYLKDVAAVIRGSAVGTSKKGSPTMNFVVQQAFRMANVGPSDVQIVESNAKSILNDVDLNGNVRTWSSNSSLSGLCELVWLLRGWTQNDSVPKTYNCLQCSISPNGAAAAIVLSRADGEVAPAFKDVEHKNDSRERFGYNPAIQTRDIVLEDWESVKARREFSDERAADKVRFRRKGGDRAALSKI